MGQLIKGDLLDVKVPEKCEIPPPQKHKGQENQDGDSQCQ